MIHWAAEIIYCIYLLLNNYTLIIEQLHYINN